MVSVLPQFSKMIAICDSCFQARRLLYCTTNKHNDATVLVTSTVPGPKLLQKLRYPNITVNYANITVPYEYKSQN